MKYNLQKLAIPTVITFWFIQALRSYLPGIYIALFHVVFKDPGYELELLKLGSLFVLLLPLLTGKIFQRFSKIGIERCSLIIISILRVIMAFRINTALETWLPTFIIIFYSFYIISSRSISDNNIQNFITVFLLAILIDISIRSFGLTTDLLWSGPILFQVIVHLSLGVCIIGIVTWEIKKTSLEPVTSEANDLFTPPSDRYQFVFAAFGMGAALYLLMNVYFSVESIE